MAIPADQIDEAKAEEARRRAEARLAEHNDDEETATVHAALANSMAQLAVKRRRRHSSAGILPEKGRMRALNLECGKLVPLLNRFDWRGAKRRQAAALQRNLFPPALF